MSRVRKRSIAIRGHRTSFSLEDTFYDGLVAIADMRRIALASLVTEIDETRPRDANLSSALRLHVLEWSREAGQQGAAEPSDHDTGAASELRLAYQGYIECLNAQDWRNLGRFVHPDARYNGTHVGLAGYQEMLEGDFRAIPDLRFEIGLLACDPPRIASRLLFECTPTGSLFGLEVNGRRVRFSENVFCEFRDGRIIEVWSVIDKAAVAAQLQGRQ